MAHCAVIFAIAQLSCYIISFFVCSEFWYYWMSCIIRSKTQLFLPVACYGHISRNRHASLKHKNQQSFEYSTQLNCSNAAVRRKHTAHKANPIHTALSDISDMCNFCAYFKWLLYSTASATTQKNTPHVSLWCWCAYKILRNSCQQVNFQSSQLLFPEWGGICRSHMTNMCWTSVRYWSSCEEL